MVTQTPLTWTALRDWRHLLACGFGLGLSPKAPGTLASAFALLLYALVLYRLPTLYYVLFVCVVFFAGIYLCGITAYNLSIKDHPAIVWDEFVGMWVALIVIEQHWLWLLLAFILFRILDIFKPPPISLAESLPSGWGIVMDDVVAGIATAGLLYGAQMILIAVNIY